LLAAGMASLGLAACGDVAVTIHAAGSPDATLDPALPSASAPAPFTLGPAPAAAEITGLRLRPLGGAAVPLTSLLGARGTVVAFWASTCAACVGELPALQRLEPVLGRQGVRLLLADVGDDDATAAGFLGGHGIHLAPLADDGGAARDGLGLLGVPTTALLGPDGTVRHRLEGAADLGPLDLALAAMGISAQ
jgi:thiol-disulfide isomerase/thioredoxin